MAEKTETAPAKRDPNVEVVTAEDLLKSLKELEGKTDAPAPKKEPVVEKTKVPTTAEAIEEVKTGSLRKALDVSGALDEFCSTIGDHVDNVVETLQKAVNGSAERDHAIIRVLKDLRKSVDDLTTKVEAFGKTPAAVPKTKTAASGAEKTEVLEKGVAIGEEKGDEDPKVIATRTRKQVLDGLDTLVKSVKIGSSEQQEYINAAVKFEVTGQISNQMLHKAISAYKKGVA